MKLKNAPWISKDPWFTEDERKLIIRWGDGVGVCARGFLRFECYKCRERLRPGECSSSLKILGHMFRKMKWSGTFTAKGCWESAKLWGELLTLTLQIICGDCIYKIGKARKHIFHELAGRGSQWGSNRQSAWQLVSEFHPEWARWCLEPPLQRCEPYTRQGADLGFV